LIGRFWRLVRLGPQISGFSGLQVTSQRTHGGWLVILASSLLYTVNTGQLIHNLHCKKRFAVFPSPAGMSLTKLSLWPEIIKLFPARESLVSDNRLGTGKSLTFFTVHCFVICVVYILI
jgi:hypothetical protein